MTVNSREKGKRGERELAEFLRDHGYPGARRSQQYSGTESTSDIVCPGLEALHLECKRAERTLLYPWLAQAIRDAGESGKVPVVAHRTSGADWVAIMRLEDFLTLLFRATL